MQILQVNSVPGSRLFLSFQAYIVFTQMVTNGEQIYLNVCLACTFTEV
jgi:hypothetical protein